MIDIINFIAVFIALAALLIAFIRLLKGPTVADRIISLDTMTIISISIIAFIASYTMRIIYIDVAAVYALISFIGVVAIARHLEGGL